jgi:riboflavin synthase
VFTGIAEEVGRVRALGPDELTVAATTVVEDAEVGASISVNGVCLTVTRFDDVSFTVGLMPETLRLTNIGRLKAGDGVNLERAMKLGGRLGGHLVQGHVDGLGRVASIRRDGGAMLVGFEAPPEVMRYVADKGFVAVDGLSLTVVARSSTSFEVSIVEFTRRHTTLGERRVGDAVNLEADIIAKYVEAISRPSGSGITSEFLREHGFAVG